MTVIVVYGIVPLGGDPPMAGLDSGLGLMPVGEVAVVYGERADVPGTDRDEVLAFGEVVGRLADEGAVLPARYGTVVDTVEELREVAEQRAEEWHKRLAHVEGHVELVLHLDDTGAPQKAPSGVSGREYLLSRARVQRHADTVAEEVRALVAPCCREVRRLPGQDGVRLACLVRREDVSTVSTALQGWADAASGRSVRVTGPWPPYSFSEEEPS